ncbi:hypothetical protein GMORB2_0939 [Geosmithia morbida]|uniref:Aflatoxin regulatory protein domain-containing protein n=1 Tax=Geosmithia morbida TaxID=1094350 RepID=A0A9P4Z0Z5_9HYPO|nr:uncharacterized protein GMORB2_0939 [Geosmithia morbida]KAF4125695.1 hypothetical protein GMORB2_0939 [Geosmithia morbida]
MSLVPDCPVPSYSSASLSDDSSLFNFSQNAPFVTPECLGNDFSLEMDRLSADYLKDTPGDYNSMDLGLAVDQTWPLLPAGKVSCVGKSASSRDDDCSCAQSAAQMLSHLDSKIHTIGDLSVDAILTYQSCAISQLNYWLVCEHCDSPRTTTKVIVLVVEGLCLCMERVVAEYVSQVQAGMSEETRFPTVSCNIGKYSINTWHEWNHILRVSLLCRCSDLHTAVTKLQERDVLSSMLKETEQNLADMINQLRRCESYL